MRYFCKKCEFLGVENREIVRHGFYYRTSDSKWVQKFRCNVCRLYFSTASFHPCYKQKKRGKNERLKELLCSGVSLRRAARILRLHRTTVVRKFLYLSFHAEYLLRSRNFDSGRASIVEFDDMETFEHSKYKPLSITLAVESGTRRVLGVEVSQMASKITSPHARCYLPRKDTRIFGRRELFRRLGDLVEGTATFKSDSNPYYPKDLKRAFPESTHLTYLSRRAAVTGQGELKRGRFDPIFSLNHTCAKFRADISRLFRKTWCTTKRADRLYAHLILYADYHNAHLQSG